MVFLFSDRNPKYIFASVPKVSTITEPDQKKLQSDSVALHRCIVGLHQGIVRLHRGIAALHRGVARLQCGVVNGQTCCDGRQHGEKAGKSLFLMQLGK